MSTKDDSLGVRDPRAFRRRLAGRTKVMDDMESEETAEGGGEVRATNNDEQVPGGSWVVMDTLHSSIRTCLCTFQLAWGAD